MEIWWFYLLYKKLKNILLIAVKQIAPLHCYQPFSLFRVEEALIILQMFSVRNVRVIFVAIIENSFRMIDDAVGNNSVRNQLLVMSSPLLSNTKRDRNFRLVPELGLSWKNTIIDKNVDKLPLINTFDPRALIKSFLNVSIILLLNFNTLQLIDIKIAGFFWKHFIVSIKL